jgi:hypothetical protein
VLAFGGGGGPEEARTTANVESRFRAAGPTVVNSTLSTAMSTRLPHPSHTLLG